MPEQQGRGADAPDATATTTTTTAATTTAPAGVTVTAATPRTPPPAAASEPAAPSHGDWAGMQKALRAIRDQLERLDVGGASRGKAAPASGAEPVSRAEFDAMVFDGRVKDALLEHGIRDAQLVRLVQTTARAERPEDVSAFVAGFARFSPQPVTSPATPAPPPAPSTNTGPPAAAPASKQMPENPLQWDPAVVRAMSVEDYRKALAEYDQRHGRGNPFAALRRR